jgi:hypothetical protein
MAERVYGERNHTSTFGVVALSILIGLFLALLIGAAGFLIYVGFGFRKTVIETQTTLTQHREEWSTTLKSLGVMLETHRAEINRSISSINGDELARAVKLFTTLVQEQRASATRIERAASAIGRFTTEWLARESLGPDLEPITEGIDESTGYAASTPGEPPYITRSRTAADDAQVLADEGEQVTETFQP